METLILVPTLNFLLSPIQSALADDFNSYNASLVLSTYHCFNSQTNVVTNDDAEETEMTIVNEEQNKSFYIKILTKNVDTLQCFTNQGQVQKFENFEK